MNDFADFYEYDVVYDAEHHYVISLIWLALVYEILNDF